MYKISRLSLDKSVIMWYLWGMETIMAGVKLVATRFAEYLNKNEWVKRERTHPNYVGMYWSHLHCEYKSIEDLYEMFKLEETNKS